MGFQLERQSPIHDIRKKEAVRGYVASSGGVGFVEAPGGGSEGVAGGVVAVAVAEIKAGSQQGGGQLWAAAEAVDYPSLARPKLFAELDEALQGAHGVDDQGLFKQFAKGCLSAENLFLLCQWGPAQGVKATLADGNYAGIHGCAFGPTDVGLGEPLRVPRVQAHTVIPLLRHGGAERERHYAVLALLEVSVDI